MDGKDDLKKAFDNPCVNELLRSDSDMINYSVMRIASSLELLENAVGSPLPSSAAQYIDVIRAMCRNLQRSSAMKHAFAAEKKEAEPIRIDRFAEDFAAGCRSVLGDRLKLAASFESGGIVKTDPELIRLVLLAAVRKAAENCTGKELGIGVLTSAENGKVSLTLKTESDFIDKKEFGAYGVNPFFEKNFGDIVEAASERIGAEAKVGDNVITLTFKREDESAGVMLKSPFAYFDPGNYSFYRFMLSDFDRG